MLLDERNEIRATIAQFRIPKGTVASLAGLANSEISEYLHGHRVAGSSIVRIEHAVKDLVSLLEFFKEYFSMRPDLKDVESLKEAIQGLNDIRRVVEAQRELEATTAEVVAGFKLFVGN